MVDYQKPHQSKPMADPVVDVVRALPSTEAKPSVHSIFLALITAAGINHSLSHFKPDQLAVPKRVKELKIMAENIYNLY